MPIITPDTGGSIVVADANGTTRVEIGQFTNEDGEPTGDYGLRVISSDGSTEIIDGDSDVFTIIASGGLEVLATADGATGSANFIHTDLTGYSVVPAFMAFISLTAGGEQFPGVYTQVELSGGAIVIRSHTEAYMTLNAGRPQVFLQVFNELGVAIDRYCKYYILRQLGL